MYGCRYFLDVTIFSLAMITTGDESTKTLQANEQEANFESR